MEDGLLAMLRSRGPDAAWTSSDGRVWWEVGSELEVPGVVEEGDPFSGLGPRKAPDAWASLGSGWLVLQDGKFSFQSDGNEDVRVRKSQIPPLVARDGFDGPGQAISHETTVIWRDIPGGANSLWILTLDAVGEERRSD